MCVSIPDSDRALPKYKFKDTLQSRLLDILIQEDTSVLPRYLRLGRPPGLIQWKIVATWL